MIARSLSSAIFILYVLDQKIWCMGRPGSSPIWVMTVDSASAILGETDIVASNLVEVDSRLRKRAYRQAGGTGRTQQERRICDFENVRDRTTNGYGIPGSRIIYRELIGLAHDDGGGS